MIDSGLFLLPLFALLFLYRFTWLGKGDSVLFLPRKRQRRQRAWVMLNRFIIPSLLMATVIAFTRPIEALPDLVFGIVITVIFMTPVCLYLLAVELAARIDEPGYKPESSAGNAQHIKKPDVTTSPVPQARTPPNNPVPYSRPPDPPPTEAAKEQLDDTSTLVENTVHAQSVLATSYIDIDLGALHDNVTTGVDQVTQKDQPVRRTKRKKEVPEY